MHGIYTDLAIHANQADDPFDSSVSELEEAPERETNDEASYHEPGPGTGSGSGPGPDSNPDPDPDPDPNPDPDASTEPEDEWDADDIVDIVPDRRVGRKLSAQRLAMALADDQDPEHWRASYLVPSLHSCLSGSQSRPCSQSNAQTQIQARTHFQRARTRTLPARTQPYPAPARPVPSPPFVRSNSEGWNLAPHIARARSSRQRTTSAVPALTFPEEQSD